MNSIWGKQYSAGFARADVLALRFYSIIGIMAIIWKFIYSCDKIYYKLHQKMLLVFLPQFNPSLTLINATYFYNYLTRGGAQSSSPLKSTKNQGLRVKHGKTLKYWQLLGSRKKLRSIPPKLGPYRGNQNFRKNAENRDFKKFAI